MRHTHGDHSQEILQHTREKTKTKKLKGLIRAEAITKCGGERAFLEALDKKEVVQSTNEDGITLFFFPSSVLADTEGTKQTEQASRRLGHNLHVSFSDVSV